MDKKVIEYFIKVLETFMLLDEQGKLSVILELKKMLYKD